MCTYIAAQQRAVSGSKTYSTYLLFFSIISFFIFDIVCLFTKWMGRVNLSQPIVPLVIICCKSMVSSSVWPLIECLHSSLWVFFSPLEPLNFKKIKIHIFVEKLFNLHIFYFSFIYQNPFIDNIQVLINVICDDSIGHSVSNSTNVWL